MAAHTTCGKLVTPSIRNAKFHVFLILVALVLNCKTVFGQQVTLSPLCGSNLYDIDTLQAAPYWTITRPGICYDTWGEEDLCTINLAFCKALPLDKTHNQQDMGASQELPNAVGNTPLVLGQISRLVDDVDGAGGLLIVTYPGGDQVNCGQLNVIVFLNCNRDVQWEVPISGPGVIPRKPIVTLDRMNKSCVYTIVAEYAGACEQSSTLSVGTIIIIIFVCFLAVYLIGGLIYNKASGASGVELIPNHEIWNRLPRDIMLGCSFFFNTITCQGDAHAQASNDAYDKI